MIKTLLHQTFRASVLGLAVWACQLGAAQAQESQAAQADQGQARTIWKEGQPAPPLRLPTIDGTETIDLADLRGGPILLLEFASW